METPLQIATDALFGDPFGSRPNPSKSRLLEAFQAIGEFPIPLIVENYAEARALTGLTDGDQVIILGRSNRLDGGEGTFYWNAVNLLNRTQLDEVTAGEGDGGVYIALNTDKTGATGALQRRFTGKHNAGWYGVTRSATSAQIIAGLTAAARRPGGFRLSGGNYNIDNSLTIVSDIEFDEGATLSCPAANFIFIDGLVEAGPRQRIITAGQLAISNRTALIHPAWWQADPNGNTAVDSSPQIQAAFINSHFQRNTVVLSLVNGLGSRLFINNNARSIVLGQPEWHPQNNNPNAVVFGEGDLTNQIQLPALVNWSETAVEVQANNAEIDVMKFISCGNCVLLSVGASGGILNSVVETGSIEDSEAAVVFRALDVSNIIRGSGLRVKNHITGARNGAVFDGAGFRNDGNFLEAQSVQFRSQMSNGAFLDNKVPGHEVNAFTAIVKGWFGGDGFDHATPTQLIRGAFDNCNVQISTVREYDERNMVSATYIGGRIETSLRRRRSQAPDILGQGSGLANFSGGSEIGRMSSRTVDIVKFTLPQMDQFSFAAFEYFNIWADSETNPWTVHPISGAGLIELRINQFNTGNGRMVIEARPLLTSGVPAGTEVIVMLRRN